MKASEYKPKTNDMFSYVVLRESDGLYFDGNGFTSNLDDADLFTECTAMEKCKNLTNELTYLYMGDIEQNNVAELKTTFYQLIGWSSLIHHENRNSSNMSDGAMFSSKKLAKLYVRLNNFHTLKIKEHSAVIGQSQKNHIDCFILPPYMSAECNNGECNWVGSYNETVHPKHDTDCLLCPECNETIELICH